LGGTSAIAGIDKPASMPLLIPHCAKGRIADNDIMRMLGLVLTGIELRNAIALSPQVGSPVRIQLIDGDPGWVRADQ
jgi:hypothetical protein